MTSPTGENAGDAAAVSNDPGAWIDQLATHGNREALFTGGATGGVTGGAAAVGPSSYAQLAAAASRLARGLRDCGIEPGDVVAVWASPSRAGVALIHAMIDCRIVLLPLNARLTAEEMSEALVHNRVRRLIVGHDIDRALAARVTSAANCGLVEISSVEEGQDEEGRDTWATLQSRRPAPERSASDLERDRARLLDDEIAFLIQTSGTSGRPKSAMLTRANLVASALASIRLLGSAPNDRWLLCMPLFHIGGLSVLIRSAIAGTSVAIHERFNVRRVAAALETDGITRISLVSTMLTRLLDERPFAPAPKELVLVLLGGGPAPPELLRRAEDLGYPIAPTYGMTETASQVATRPPSDRVAAPNSSVDDRAGGLQPLPGVDIRVTDASGRSRSALAEGEIHVRGPIVMRGYFGDAAATREAIQEGWLATGDLGRLDEAGRLRVLDRRTDLIISGGENIYPAEIESILCDHRDVVDAAVVGRADAEFGSRPVAFVVLRSGVEFDRADLESFCRDRLAAYKVPVDFVARRTLPRTASGKLQRRALRELAARASANDQA